MSIFEAILLGIVQGVTEFFPVSSSGHLILGEFLFGFKDLEQYIPFDLVCHLGTLLAIICVFHRDLIKLFTFENKRLFIRLGLSIAPLVPLYFLLKPIKAIYNQPQYIGFFFLITAGILFIGEKIRLKTTSRPDSYRDSLIIGAVQAIAILPGVSRSGSTISCATVLGWQRQEAARFSFLMALPTILGGCLLEFASMTKVKQNLPPIPLNTYIIGFLFSFITGFLALNWILKITKKGNFKPFIYYCLALGIFSVIYINGFIKTV